MKILVGRPCAMLDGVPTPNPATAPQAEPVDGRSFPAKAKGARPVFFADGGATDAVLAIVTSLAAEVWALRERVTTLETVLAAGGTIPASAVEAHRPSPAEAERRAAEAAAFTARVFRVFEEMREEVLAGETPGGYEALVQRAYDEI
ncbi:MAG: hypothetical protein OEY41_06905 [Acidimicrobiia bacterium]|nr:hypothetical protein [Acidimicrobiia bacterium]MDH4363841.1 hypothetical protein [Acidimicrobiia bacterium]MDH5289711.1 hypothetical protein [Acidimicrobiia bacterium]